MHMPHDPHLAEAMRRALRVRSDITDKEDVWWLLLDAEWEHVVRR